MTRIVVATAFGGPENLELRDVETPSPGADEVAVQLRAIGVNPFDIKRYSGAFGTDASTLPLRLGTEAAGVVIAVGAGAIGPAGPVTVGDEVIVGSDGTYAETVVVPADAVIPKPENLTWEEAAGFMQVTATAFDALEVAKVTSGDTVLVHGASGGVGSATVQMALSRGAAVIGTAGAHNQDAIRDLGATSVVYGDGLTERVQAVAPNGVDAAIDTVGTDEAVDVSLEFVADRKRIVTTAAFGRVDTDGIVPIGGGGASAQRRRSARLALIDAALRGEVTVTVAAVYPLADAARAHRELQSSHPRGKYVLVP